MSIRSGFLYADSQVSIETRIVTVSPANTWRLDEAAGYFDDNIDDLLTQARKYKLGLLFSHQYLTQLAPALHSSIASNTSIKLAGGVSDRDARSMAR
jgi:hypothetical protein